MTVVPRRINNIVLKEPVTCPSSSRFWAHRFWPAQWSQDRRRSSDWPRFIRSAQARPLERDHFSMARTITNNIEKTDRPGIPAFLRFRLRRADLRIRLVALPQAIPRPCGLCADIGARGVHRGTGGGIMAHIALRKTPHEPASHVRVCRSRNGLARTRLPQDLPLVATTWDIRVAPPCHLRALDHAVRIPVERSPRSLLPRPSRSCWVRPFPLVTSAVLRWSSERAGNDIAALYFLNSLGATIGVLASRHSYRSRRWGCRAPSTRPLSQICWWRWARSPSAEPRPRRSWSCREVP